MKRRTTDPIYTAIGARIAAHRKAADKTQAAVGQVLDLSQSVYARIESGEVPIRLDQLIKVCRLLGVRARNMIGSILD